MELERLSHYPEIPESKSEESEEYINNDDLELALEELKDSLA